MQGRARSCSARSWLRPTVLPEGQQLLALAMPVDLLEYLHWYLQQFTDQTAGLPPWPWTGYRR